MISFLSRRKLVALCILSLLLLTAESISAKHLLVYKSGTYNPEAVNAVSEKVAVNYDKKGNLFFGTAHNDSVFFVRVIFQDQKSLMKILFNGMSIYFDPSGKKKTNYQLKLERTHKSRAGGGRMSGDYGSDMQNQRMRSLAGMADQVLTKVTWNKNGKTVVFDRKLFKSSIKIGFTENEKNQPVFDLTMPVAEIPLNKDQQIFSLGIETNGIEQNSFSGSGSRQGGIGGRSGSTGQMGQGEMSGGITDESGDGMSGGNMRGHGGGIRGHGGSTGGSSSAGYSRPAGGDVSNIAPVELWFQVEF